MKKVNIRQMGSPDHQSVFTERKKYSVYLGNHSTSLFSNEKKAKKFLTDVNRVMNSKLVDLNMIYIEIFNEWRRCWLALNDNLDNNFNSVNKMFRMSVNTFSNQNHWAFTHIINISNEFLFIASKLKEYYINNKDFASATIIKSICKRIEIIITDLDELGKKKPGQVNDQEKIIT
jgi:hypothetical protein